MGCIWSGLFIRSNQNIPGLVNPFLLQENQKFFIFSKMILRVMPKFLPILLVLGASVVQFSTQKIFQIITVHQLCLENFSTEPQLCNKVIQSVSSDCNFLMWMYKVKKCNFYVSSSVNNDLKTCSYVGFCSIF